MKDAGTCMKTNAAKFLAGVVVFCFSIISVWSGYADAAYTATLYGNMAPVGANNLDYVDYEQPEALFSRSFTIPYATIEPLINDEIKKAVDPYKNMSGTEVCETVLCPDVHWEVQIKSIKFNFTDQGQPQLSTFGPPEQNGVAVAFHTGANLTSDITAHVWQGGIGPLDDTMDLHIVISMEMDTTGKFKFYPVIDKVENVKVTFSADPTVNINGLEAALAKAGAELGAMVGFTPLGLALGGPVVFSSFMAVFGATEAADLAEEELDKYIEKYVADAAKNMESQINSRINSFLDAKITQARNIKDEIMNSSIPGVNKSLSQLQKDIGLVLDVRTFTPGSDVKTYVTLRYDGKGGTGSIAGKVRMPKEVCEYSWGYKKQTGAIAFHHLTDGNTDLKDKVGQPCSQILQGDAINRLVFLGATPPGTNMPNWKGIGSLHFTGNLKEFSDYYECGYEITGLPNVGVVRLDGGPQLKQRIPDHDLKRTYLVLSEGNNALLFDNLFNPITPGGDGTAFGGKGRCKTGGVGGGAAGLTPDLGKELKDLLDPDKCPQCRLVFKPGTGKVNIMKGTELISLAKDVESRLKPMMPGFRVTKGIGQVPGFDEETMKPMQGESPFGPGKSVTVARGGKMLEMKKPDLVVDKFWVERVKPGEKLPNGKIADKTYLYFNWKVRNIGDAHSKATKLKVSCIKQGQEPCPSGIDSFAVGPLWPKPGKPNDPAGAEVFSNKTPVPASGSQKYTFTATVDPGNEVHEKNEDNNKLVSHFDSRVFIAAGRGAVSTGKSGGKAGVKRAKIELIEKPVLVIESIAVKPAPLREGNPVTVMVNLKNKGKASGRDYRVKLRCIPPAGVKDCFVPDGVHDVKPRELKPGYTGGIKLHGVKPAKAGTYRIEATILPKDKKSKRIPRPFTAVFTVKPAIQIKKPASIGKRHEAGSEGRREIKIMKPVEPSGDDHGKKINKPGLRLNTR